jgi:hypothetical protein
MFCDKYIFGIIASVVFNISYVISLAPPSFPKVYPLSGNQESIILCETSRHTRSSHLSS